jgi:hypothetical protein
MTIAGGVEFEWDGPGTPLAALERAIGTEFEVRREITDRSRDYDGGEVLGLRFWLTLSYRDDDGYSALLVYRNDDGVGEEGAVNIDEHIVALLAQEGISARPR